MRFRTVSAGAGRAGVALLAVVGCLLCWAGTALAGTGFASSSFSSPEGFAGPVGLAVDGSGGLSRGDVYVADQGHNRLDKFTAAGGFISGVEVPDAAPDQLTVDDYPGLLEGDVYLAGHADGVVYRFSPGLVMEAEVEGLSEPTAVAVDEAGDVFVAELAGSTGSGKVLEFNAAGEPVNATGALDAHNTVVVGLNVPSALAVSAKGTTLYVATGSGTLVYELVSGSYTAGGTLDHATSDGVSIAASGDVYVDRGAEVLEYEAAGVQLVQFGAGVLSGGGYGVGVGASGVYVADRYANVVDLFEEGATPLAPAAPSVSAVKATTATLSGELKSGGGASGYYFAYNSTGGSCEGGATTEPAAAMSGPVSSEATGLLPATRYMVCLVARNKYGVSAGPAVSFETKSVPPAVEEVSFSDVGSGSAILHGRIDALGSPTEYHFEYGPTGAYGAATPVVSVGAGLEAVAVQATLDGLTSASEYHFRLIARNANGETTEGSDVTFRTLPEGTLGLPDGRVFERVSPAEDQNADVYTPDVFGIFLPLAEGTFTKLPFDVSADGNAVVYAGDPTSGGTGQDGQNSGNQYLATRSPGGGWTQSNITPAGRFSAHYQGFSSDLSVGVLSVSSVTGLEDGAPPLSPEAPGEGYRDLYKHSNGGGSYQAFLTTSATLHRNPEAFKTVYAGASADLSQVFFEANDALTESAPELAPEPEYWEYNLYDSVDGHLSLVNVLPDGSAEPHAVFGAPPLGGDKVYDQPADYSHAVSTDGSRVFWTNLEVSLDEYGRPGSERPVGLYVRENPSQPESPLDAQGACTVAGDACTVQVDAAVGGGGRFWTATPDGSKVFFTKGDLYEYDLENGQTTDLTPGVEVKGVIGASEDGEYVYYADSTDNLEVWHAGASTLIRTLSAADGEENTRYRSPGAERFGDWEPGFAHRTAEVSADGRAVAFMAKESLKTEQYPDGYPSGGREEVYVYEAEGGQLFCASCSPSGEPPSGSGYFPVSWNATFMPNLVSADGSRVFFDSEGQPLVAQDTNGKQDVYEWERDGAGSCRESGGCVYLLSGGTSGAASWLLGASASGDDVFVISRAPLVPGSPYDSFDLYDARVGGVQPLAPPACSGAGCQGVPPAPPIFATPASVTFGGVGNFPQPSTGVAGKSKPKAKRLTRARKLANALKACQKHKHARAACKRQARRRYGSKANAKRSAREGK
jgi:hypothetical protein